MAKWFPFVLAAAVGALAALASALAMPPLLAFAAGALLALAGAAALRALAEDAARSGAAPAGPAGGGDAVGIRAGADREAADAAPRRLAHRAGGLRQPGGAGRRCRGCEPGAHFAHLIRAPAFVEAVTATLADGEERRVRFRPTRGGSGSSRRASGCCRRATPSGRRRRASCRSRT